MSGLCPGTLDVNFAYKMDGTGYKASWGSSPLVKLEVSAMDNLGRIGMDTTALADSSCFHQRPAL